MKLKIIFKLFVLIFIVISNAKSNVVHKITIDGAINPVATEFIIQSIAEAEDVNAELLVIKGFKAIIFKNDL